MSLRQHFKQQWPQIAGVDAHLAHTGEQAPSKWCDTPADMLHHGGYAAVSARGIEGPFAWYENAATAAGAMARGLVVRWTQRRHWWARLKAAWEAERIHRRRQTLREAGRRWRSRNLTVARARVREASRALRARQRSAA